MSKISPCRRPEYWPKHVSEDITIFMHHKIKVNVFVVNKFIHIINARTMEHIKKRLVEDIPYV